jgi:hypothetical protein
MQPADISERRSSTSLLTVDQGKDWGIFELAMRVLGSQEKGTTSKDVLQTKDVLEGEPQVAQEAAEAESNIDISDGKLAIDYNMAAASNDNPTIETPGKEASEVQTAIPQARVIAGASGRQRRTPEQMADIVLNALRTVPGVQDRGFVVTVYGTNPWNAMLTVNPEAGPIKDAPLWRTRVQDIAVRLREEFDVMYE